MMQRLEEFQAAAGFMRTMSTAVEAFQRVAGWFAAGAVGKSPVQGTAQTPVGGSPQPTGRPARPQRPETPDWRSMPQRRVQPTDLSLPSDDEEDVGPEAAIAGALTV